MTNDIGIEKICEWCKKPFVAQKLTTRYCSHSCNSKAYKAAKRDENRKIYNVVSIGAKRFQQIEALSEAYEKIKDKEYLSVRETSILLSVGRETVYRYLRNNVLKSFQANGKTFIRRSDIDKIFDDADRYNARPTKEKKAITDFYSLAEIKEKFNVKDSWIYKIVRENKIPKTLIRGKSYFSKTHIDRFFEKKNTAKIQDITEWYSVKELQEKYNLTSAAIYSFVSENDIPKRKDGRYVFYSKTHFDIAKRITVPEFYSVGEAMLKFGLTRDSLYHYLKTYNVPKIKSGRYLKISKSDLDKLFENLK